MRRKTLCKAKLIIVVEGDKTTGKIRTTSIFDNRTQQYWSADQIMSRGCEWFLNRDDLKETLNWNLNGDSSKYQFAWGQTSKNKSEGAAYIFD